MQREKIIMVVGVAAFSTIAGAIGGVLVTNKRLEDKYVAIAEQEIEEAKRFYGRVYKKDEFQTPAQAVEELVPEAERKAAEALREYQGEQIEVVPSDEPLMTEDEIKKGAPGVEKLMTTEIETRVKSNIFVDGKPLEEDEYDEDEEDEEEFTGDWDQEKEELKRRNGKPYILHVDEFRANDSDYDQAEVTYFEQDDVLVDDRDEVIDDIERTIGLDCLQRFGYGSGDPNVVFVRNEQRELDFEVRRSAGSYVETVHGFLEHSSKSTVRRFRGDYDE